MNLFFSRLFSAPLLPLLTLAAALGGCAPGGGPTPSPEPVGEPVAERQERLLAAGLNLCGTVQSYVPVGLLSTGLLVVEGVPLLLPIGSQVQGESMLTIGAEVCLTSSLELGGAKGLAVSVNASADATVKVCGVVSSYTAASALLNGAVTIAGQNLPIKAGTQLANGTLLTTGADVCLQATLTTLGQVAAPGTITANAAAQVGLCGVVDAYVAATNTAAGLLRIGQNELPILVGTTIANDDLLKVGLDACVNASVSANGQIGHPTHVVAQAVAHAKVCGTVDAYVAATSSTEGVINLNGTSLLTIRAETVIDGAATLAVGASVCCDLSLDAIGKVVATSTCAASSGEGAGGSAGAGGTTGTGTGGSPGTGAG
ncbi:MAG: hypothetical protein EOO75_18600, partial [Myxococcales bacterium]